MGKLVQQSTVIHPEEGVPETETVYICLSKSTWKWLLAIFLGLYVLVFALWSFGFRGSSGRDTNPSSSDPVIPHIEASFRLRRALSTINSSLPQLQVDLQEELGIPGTQIDIISLTQIPFTNWTEIQFKVSPDQTNNSLGPAELSILKETFVELFTQRSLNLSLSEDVFGKVSHFEVIDFPGGITVVPDQPGFPLSKVFVLFNFTLHNSLSHVNSNFQEFKKQLAAGVTLKPNENLFVQLTNLEGSTLKSPLVVQTSILPVVGASLSTPRLKQLAEDVIASPRRNLGLNHTLFGRVKKIQLSSYLQYSLGPAQAPSPAPGPAPSPSDGHGWVSRQHNSRRVRRHHRCSQVGEPSSYSHVNHARSPTPAVSHHRSHHRHSSVSVQAPTPMTNRLFHHKSCNTFPPQHAQQSASAPSSHGFGKSHIFKSPSPTPSNSVRSPSTAPKYKQKSQPPKGAPTYFNLVPPPKEAPTYGRTFKPPKEAPSYSHMFHSPEQTPSFLTTPEAAPQIVAPASASGPSQSRERIDILSPTSSAFLLEVPLWLVLTVPVILAGITL